MGIREMWLVDTVAEEIEVRLFAADAIRTYKIGDTLRSEILPLIGIPVAAALP